jgi:hypothetical protein
LESANGPEALIEPIVSSVSLCMKPQWTALGHRWVEAFDRIPLVSLMETLRDLFGDKDVGQHLPTVIRNKLYAILEPAEAKPAAKVKLPPKPPRAVTRVDAVEKKIALGLQWLDLRSKTEGNIDFGRLRRKLDVEPVSAQEALRVARVYGRRPEIFRRLTWQALVELSSPSLPADARTEIEAKIMAGDRFTHTQIRARRPLKKPAQRVAA